MTCAGRLALPVLAAIFLVSCAPKQAEILLDTTRTDAATLLDRVRIKQERVATVTGSGTISFESPEMSGTAGFELALRKPDSLLVTFEGPFGIDLGTLFVSPSQFLMYNSMSNTVVRGNPASATIRSMIPFDLNVEQILGAFSGALPIAGDARSLTSYTIDDGMFLLTFQHDARRYAYWVDNRYLLVGKSEVRDSLGAVIMDASISSFTEEGDATAPRRIKIRFPNDGRQLIVNYSVLTLNDPNPSFSFSLPPTVRTIER
jgi:hypothetical protein